MAWSRVQSASASVNFPGASQALAYGSNVSSGTKLIAVVVANGTLTTSTVKDGAGNSLTKILAELLDNTAADGELSLWAMDTPAGDVGTAPTLTATFSSSAASTSGMLIQEVSGLATGNTVAAMIDGTAGANFGAGGTSTGSPTYSSSASNEYLVTCVGDNENVTNGTYTAPSGYTADPNNLNSNNFADVLIAFKNSTGGTESASWTMTTPTQWATILCAFKLASGGSNPSGTVQPRATVPVPRRQPARGQWQRVTGQAFVKVPAPGQQPRPAPRRTLARAYVQFKPVRTTNGSAATPVSGTVQPRTALPAPRRILSRAYVRFTPVTTTNAVPRGTAPAQQYRTPPRRILARALWRGGAVPGTYGAAPSQQFRMAPRRTLARALWRGITGQAFVKVPAPRQQYRTPPRRKLSRAYVRFTPVTTTNAHPVRTLLISLASVAGTDDYGNAFPQGIMATEGIIEGPTVIAGTSPNTQVVLTDNMSGTGEVQFQPNNPAFLMGVINSAVIGSPTYDSLGIIGPASTASGHGDFVEEAFNSANSAGTSTANWQIFYVDTSGGGHLVAVVDANGFTVDGPLIADNTASLNDGATVTNGLTTDTLNVTGGTIELGGGAASLTENNFNMASPMGTPPNAAAVNAGTATLAQTQAFAYAIYSEMKNRGMFS